jgi:hypothetical protein
MRMSSTDELEALGRRTAYASTSRRMIKLLRDRTIWHSRVNCLSVHACSYDDAHEVEQRSWRNPTSSTRVNGQALRCLQAIEAYCSGGGEGVNWSLPLREISKEPRADERLHESTCGGGRDKAFSQKTAGDR